MAAKFDLSQHAFEKELKTGFVISTLIETILRAQFLVANADIGFN